MPPRHTYWTIILEGTPTAFRAHTQEELLPTLRQLQSRHPDAVMKWFARGRLWHSQEEERMAAALKRRPPAGEKRTPAWRPGGDHKDPRDRFNVPRDEKRRRFAANLRRDRSGAPRPGTGGPAGSDRPPHPAGKPQWNRDSARRPDWKAKPPGVRPDHPPAGSRPRPDDPARDREAWRRERPVGRPFGGQGGGRPAGGSRQGETRGPGAGSRPPGTGRGGGRPGTGRPPSGTGRPPRGSAARFGPRPPRRPDSRKPGGGGKGGGGQGR